MSRVTHGELRKMDVQERIRIYLEAYMDEAFSSRLYAKLSNITEGELSKRLDELSKIEASHARFWREILEEQGFRVEDVKISSIKLTLYLLGARILGTPLIIKLLEAGEIAAISLYSKILKEGLLSEDKSVALRSVLEDELLHESLFRKEEEKFKGFLNHVRDAVLGMSDGLVEVLSVTAGLAGAYGDPLHTVLGGLIVGFGGATSMAIGSYVSIKSQKEIKEGQIEKIRIESMVAKEHRLRRISEILARRGLRSRTLSLLLKDLSENEDALAEISLREDLGLSEEVLEDPKRSAAYTGVFYIIGALVPTVPYLFIRDMNIGLLTSLFLTALMLGTTGVIIGISAGLSPLKKALEMIFSGLSAAAITFGVGRLASSLLGVELGKNLSKSHKFHKVK